MEFVHFNGFYVKLGGEPKPLAYKSK